MNKKQNVFYKTLVIGVVVLFIGIGIQPAIANNVFIKASKSEEDCDICPTIRNQNFVRIKSMLKRLDNNDNTLSVLSKQYPKIAVIYQELSNKVINRNMEFKHNFHLETSLTICDILALFMFPILMFGSPFLSLFDYSVENSKVLLFLISLLGITVTNIFWLPTAIIYFYVLKCQ
ncbi:hypothetical protein AYK21_02870 [Thermoplasmatales archaeon SG8-52-2]|nr:MAG: hypothetical protein AYK21_02870 [Thermoplasmatales archaeon SG8-52-2]